MANKHIMAGILELRRPRRHLIAFEPEINPKVLELQAAKEILAEIFGIRASEIDEMLKLRYEESLERPKASCRKRTQGEPLLKHRYNEVEVWPMEFCLVD
ncbi:Uncharacterised protein [uncultured archaeon]|nr:Uncharacterised protein [uncultured archaeon]